MLLARQLLGDPQQNVGTVASHLGYASQGALGHAFKGAFGHSPKDPARLVTEQAPAAPASW